MARDGHSFKISQDLWDAFKHLRTAGRELSIYKSDNAAMESLIAYMLYFRRPHSLNLGELDLYEQDLVHEYIKHCVLNDLDDRNNLPKRATARDVLALARNWKAGK